MKKILFGALATVVSIVGLATFKTTETNFSWTYWFQITSSGTAVLPSTFPPSSIGPWAALAVIQFVPRLTAVIHSITPHCITTL